LELAERQKVECCSINCLCLSSCCIASLTDVGACAYLSTRLPLTVFPQALCSSTSRGPVGPLQHFSIYVNVSNCWESSSTKFGIEPLLLPFEEANLGSLCLNLFNMLKLLRGASKFCYGCDSELFAYEMFHMHSLGISFDVLKFQVFNILYL